MWFAIVVSRVTADQEKLYRWGLFSFTGLRHGVMVALTVALVGSDMSVDQFS